MILVEARIRPSAPSVRLHPRLTVVVGLKGRERSSFCERVALMLSGQPAELEAVVDIHGQVAALTAHRCRELGTAPAAWLSVLTPAQLPGARTGPMAADERDRRLGELDARRRALRLRRAALEARVGEASRPVDTRPVEDAMAALRRAREEPPPPSPTALWLARRWLAQQSRLAALGGLPPPAADLTRGGDADRPTDRPPGRPAPDAVQIRALEEAHEELMQAELQAGEEGDSPRIVRRLFWARQHESQLLDELGAEFYDDFRRRLTAPEAPSTSGAHQAPPPAPAVEDDRATLERELAATRADAIALLGSDPGDDRLEAALLAHVDHAGDTDTKEVVAARDRLARALGTLDPASPSTDPEAAAEAWLAAAADAPQRRERLARDLQGVETALAAVDDRLGRAGRRPDELDRDEVDLTGVAPLEAEMFVLARLVALSAGGRVGPIPLVVDDAAAGLPGGGTARVLGLLARLAGDVQVVYLTDDDPEVLAWAASLDRPTAAVQRPSPAAAGFAPSRSESGRGGGRQGKRA